MSDRAVTGDHSEQHWGNRTAYRTAYRAEVRRFVMRAENLTAAGKKGNE